MSPAKHADPQIPNSTREKTDCISSPAIPVDPDDLLLLSRPVSLLKSERDVDNRVRELVVKKWASSSSAPYDGPGYRSSKCIMRIGLLLGRFGCLRLRLMEVYKMAYIEVKDLP